MADMVEKLNVHHLSKFHGGRSTYYRDMTISQFCKMAAVGHLGLVLRTFGPPMKSIWRLESMQ